MILQLFDWGYLPIFYPGNLKNPVTTDWGHRRYTRDELIRVLPSIPNESAVGLILGREGRLIDIEIDDRELAGPELAEIFPNGLPDAPGHDSSRGGHYFFAWDDRLDAIGKQKVYWNSESNAVEIRLGCLGKQTQSRIPPSKGMKWRKPLTADPMPLPEDVIERLLAKFSRCEAAQSESLRPDSRDSDEVLSDDPRRRAKAISALSFLKCYDNYEDWRKVGMALHSIGPDLFDEWDRWSRQSEKFCEGDTVKQWNGFGPGAISAGTLFYLAKEAGWTWSESDPLQMSSEANSDGQMETKLDSTPPEPSWARVFPISYFDDEPDPRVYLVENILVEGESCIISGAMKTLKTSIAMDMALSLRSGSPFLGKFKIIQPDQEFDILPEILFMSAESGKHTLHDLRLRICKSKGIDPQSELARIAFCPTVPKFDNRSTMDTFRSLLDDLHPSVLFVDPAYIAMPAGVSSSLTDMGDALYEMINTANQRNITFVLLAHNKKTVPKGPPSLDHISGVGYAEAFRQWVLLSRIGSFSSDGHHELYMMAGGSAGHYGLYTLHIDEGKKPDTFDDPPRRWEVAKVVLSEDDTDSQARRDYVDKGEEIIAALKTNGPSPKSSIGSAVGLRSKALEAHLKRLIEQRRIEAYEYQAPRATKPSPYYRLTPFENESYGQAS